MRRKIVGMTPPVSDFGAFSNAVSPLTPMYSSTAPPFPNDRSKITLSFSLDDETPRGEMRRCDTNSAADFMQHYNSSPRNVLHQPLPNDIVVCVRTRMVSILHGRRQVTAAIHIQRCAMPDCLHQLCHLGEPCLSKILLYEICIAMLSHHFPPL